MTAPSTIAYFGYGSLVNLDTLRTPYISAHRARLKGWRRAWLSYPSTANNFVKNTDMAFLSVEQAPTTAIEGLVVIDHSSSLASLDKREDAYDRVEISHDSLEFLDENPLQGNTKAYLYVAQQPAANQKTNILRSYLDAVMQGYQTNFGEIGIERFMATTTNFNCCILEDRDAPYYPRSVALNDAERELFSKFALPKTPVSF
ncbi:MAG: gamma-glutamylcyclotransferase family protein [Rhizobiaceae bacterium]